MSEAILLLRLEHRHADDLLRLIEQQLDQPDVPLDLGLLRSISEYFLDYPDQCHHPVEDRVFRRLLARDPDGGARVGPLIEDHERIASLTRAFASGIDAADADPRGQEAMLRETLRQFVSAYRAHMQGEEKVFFPLALEALTENDWSEIEFDLFDREDPLYDRAQEERFRQLRDRIEDQAKESWQRAVFLRRARRLHNLTDIASFNELMASMKAGYRLTEHPNGGFGLQRDGEVVIDIPRCSQARAVWCAYYFLEPTMRREIHV